MDTQYLDAYFTNLVYEMEASHNPVDGDPEDTTRKPRSLGDRWLLPWLVVFTAMWFGAVTLGLWL